MLKSNIALLIVCYLFSPLLIAQTTNTYAYEELGRVVTATDSTNGERRYDYDPDGDPLSIISNTACGSAGVSVSGSGFNIFGSYGPSSCTFTYTISDGRGIQSTATVSVTVN